jgi:hypothetical protein
LAPLPAVAERERQRAAAETGRGRDQRPDQGEVRGRDRAATIVQLHAPEGYQIAA